MKVKQLQVDGYMDGTQTVRIVEVEVLPEEEERRRAALHELYRSLLFHPLERERTPTE